MYVCKYVYVCVYVYKECMYVCEWSSTSEMVAEKRRVWRWVAIPVDASGFRSRSFRNVMMRSMSLMIAIEDSGGGGGYTIHTMASRSPFETHIQQAICLVKDEHLRNTPYIHYYSLSIHKSQRLEIYRSPEYCASIQHPIHTYMHTVHVLHIYIHIKHTEIVGTP